MIHLLLQCETVKCNVLVYEIFEILRSATVNFHSPAQIGTDIFIMSEENRENDEKEWDNKDSDEEEELEKSMKKPIVPIGKRLLEDPNEGALDVQILNEAAKLKFSKHRKGWMNRILKIGDAQDFSKLLTFKRTIIKKSLLKQNRDYDELCIQSFKSNWFIKNIVN